MREDCIFLENGICTRPQVIFYGSPCQEECTGYIPAEDLKDEYDQTAKKDWGKLRPTLVPTQIIWDIANVRDYGCQKYKDPDNWKRVEVERYRDALFRHLILYVNDPHGLDSESGLPHLWHLSCNAAFLCELEHDALQKRMHSPQEPSGDALHLAVGEIIYGTSESL